MPAATSKKGIHQQKSKNQQGSSVQQSTATNDTSALSEESSIDGLIASFIDKKLRNLNKRKSRLENYEEIANKGGQLTAEQKEAVLGLTEVNSMLEFLRDFQSSVQPMIQKAEKMREKREQQKKAEAETARIRDLIKIQEILNMLGDENIRVHFKEGSGSPIAMSEEQLKAADQLYEAVCPSHEGLTPEAWDSRLQESSRVAYSLLTCSPARFGSTGITFKALNALIKRIMDCDFFLNKHSSSRVESPDNQGKSETTSTISSDSQQKPEQRESYPGGNVVNGGGVMVEGAAVGGVSGDSPIQLPYQSSASYNFIQDDHSGSPQVPIQQQIQAGMHYGASGNDVSSYGGSVYSTSLNLPSPASILPVTAYMDAGSILEPRGPPSPIPMPPADAYVAQRAQDVGSAVGVATESRNLPQESPPISQTQGEDSVRGGVVAADDADPGTTDGAGEFQPASSRGRPIRGSNTRGTRGGAEGNNFRGRGGSRGGFGGARGSYRSFPRGPRGGNFNRGRGAWGRGGGGGRGQHQNE